MPGSQLLSPVAHSRRWASRFGILEIRRLPGAPGNSWTNTIKTLSTQAADVVVLCCITWPDWYDEEQERARQDLSALAQRHRCVIALTARWPDGYSSVPGIYDLLVPQDIESTFAPYLDNDDRRLLDLVLCDRREIDESRMPREYRLVDVLGARLAGALTVEALAARPGDLLREAALCLDETPTERLLKAVQSTGADLAGAWVSVGFSTDLDRHATKVMHSLCSPNVLTQLAPSRLGSGTTNTETVSISFGTPAAICRPWDIRVFYDVTETTVEVLAIVPKAQAQAWLATKGTPTSSGGAGAGKG